MEELFSDKNFKVVDLLPSGCEKNKHHALIINLSGHRMPEGVFKWLRYRKFKSFSLYACDINFDYDQDMWQQVEDRLENLSQQTDNMGKKPFEVEGSVFMLVPAISGGATMLYEAVRSLYGIPPTLFLVAYDGETRKAELKQVIEMRALAGKFRTYWRSEYLLTPRGGQIEEEIHGSSRQGSQCVGI